MVISLYCVNIHDMAQRCFPFLLVLAACMIEHLVFGLINHLCAVVFVLSLIMCVCTSNEVVLIDIKVFIYCSNLILTSHGLQGTIGVDYNFPSGKCFLCRIG